MWMCVHRRQGVSRYYDKHDRLIYLTAWSDVWVSMQLWLTWWNSRCLATDGSSKSGHSSPTSSKLSSVSTSSPGAWRLCAWWSKCEKRKQNRKRGRWKLDCLHADLTVMCVSIYSTLTLSSECMAWWRNQTVQLNFCFHQDEDLWPGVKSEKLKCNTTHLFLLCSTYGSFLSLILW